MAGGRGLRRRQRQLPVPADQPPRTAGLPARLYDNDFSSPSYGNQYGTFIFFRYLSERLHDPSIVRRIWERADGSPTGPDDFSIQAIDNALRSVAGIGFSAAFGAFAAVNAFPASFYEEGAAYPTPPIARPGQPDGRTAEARRSQDTLHHLTSAYHSLRPGAGVRANARLRVKLNLPPRVAGAAGHPRRRPGERGPALRPGDAQRAGRRGGNRWVRARQGQGGAGRADEREHSLHHCYVDPACPSPAAGCRSTTTASTGTTPSSCRRGARR